MAWRRRTTLKKIDWIPAGLFGSAGIAVVVRSLFSPDEVTNIGSRIAAIFQFGSGTAQTRTEIWQAALSSIKDRPLFGWGSDTFGQVFSRFKPAEYVRDAGGSAGADNAHDYPLHLASGIGILGALLFFAIWIWAGVRSWKTVFGRTDDPAHVSAAPNGSTRLLLGSFWAASAGYLFHLIFGISVPGSTFLLWIALALVLAPTARRTTVRARRGGTAAAIVVLLVAGLCIAGQGVVLAADRRYEIASEDFSLRDLSERTDAADRAVGLNPLVPEHRSTLGAVHGERMVAAMNSLRGAREEGGASGPHVQTFAAAFADAEAAYKEAIDFTPWDYANYVNLASVYNSAAWALDDDYYRHAVDTAKEGLEVMPFGTAIRVQLAHALFATGQIVEARETLEYCLRLDPRDGNAALALAEIYVQESREAEALALLQSVEAMAPGQRGVAAAIKALETGLPLP
jgi:tetratricopeptide (TPR) repeat protein